MRRFVLSGVALSALAMPTGVFANLLTNGGLETTAPMNQYGMVFVAPGKNATALTGWTITAGTVDIVPNSVLRTAGTAGDNFSVDMIGTPNLVGTDGLGTIEQTVTTAASTSYQLSFDFSVNPTHRTPIDEFGDTKVLQVEAIGADGHTVLASETFSDTAGTRTATDMQWALKTFTFTSDGAAATIVLSALTPINLPAGLTTATARCGPMVDNLDLEIGGGTPSPEPASLSILGLGGMLLLRRKRRG